MIGINSQIATGGGQGSVGIGFAVPVNTAKELLPQLARAARSSAPTSACNMADVTERLAEELNLPVDQGALVARPSRTARPTRPACAAASSARPARAAT